MNEERKASASEALKIVMDMYAKDRYSQLLGMKIVKAEPGRCTITMEVREDMVNGFGIVHGGVTFSLGDSALAFASNSHGRLSVAIEASISYPAPVNIGDTMTAVAEQISLTNRIAVYNISITNQHGAVVGLFKGTVYRTSKRLGQE